MGVGRFRYLLVITDGAGIRNFFITRVIDDLLETGEVCVWHDLPSESILRFKERWGKDVRWELLPDLTDGPGERFFRQAKGFAQLHWQKKERSDRQLSRIRPPSRWGPRLIAALASAIGRCSARPRGIAGLDRLHMRTALHAQHMPAFKELLREVAPDVVFSTHQRALKAVPALLAARELGIPSATFIYSWDNLPKGRMPVFADTYVVWSDHMKKEMRLYYPDISPERVVVAGTPQFEGYFDPGLRERREDFFSRYHLDPDRPVVCFSGDDIRTSPYDPVYLNDLADALGRIPAGRRPQILFRRCPVDNSDRYDGVLKSHPEIVVCDPLWQKISNGHWSQLVPTQEDQALLVNVVMHSDVVVNVGSTMALDFAIFDKPAVYVKYNPQGNAARWDIHATYTLPHFEPVHELQPVYWASSKEALSDTIMHALDNPGEKSKARRAWLELIVLQPLDAASERFASLINQFAAGSRSRGRFS